LGASPDAVAAQINPKLSAALAGDFAQRVGTVLTDFPTDALINRLTVRVPPAGSLRGTVSKLGPALAPPAPGTPQAG
jgi:hypothetical protein